MIVPARVQGGDTAEIQARFEWTFSSPSSTSCRQLIALRDTFRRRAQQGRGQRKVKDLFQTCRNERLADLCISFDNSNTLDTSAGKAPSNRIQSPPPSTCSESSWPFSCLQRLYPASLSGLTKKPAGKTNNVLLTRSNHGAEYRACPRQEKIRVHRMTEPPMVLGVRTVHGRVW